MATTTITEALAELKTIKARLEKKRANLLQYVARDNRVKDPLGEGGSQKFLREERQSINDLETRFVHIRCSIQKANLEKTVALDGKTKTVAEWINWRRDLSKEHVAFLNSIAGGIKGLRNEALKKGLRMVNNESEAKPEDLIVNLDEKALIDEQDAVTKLLGDLDGKLSLFNATTMIDVA